LLAGVRDAGGNGNGAEFSFARGDAAKDTTEVVCTTLMRLATDGGTGLGVCTGSGCSDASVEVTEAVRPLLRVFGADLESLIGSLTSSEFARDFACEFAREALVGRVLAGLRAGAETSDGVSERARDPALVVRLVAGRGTASGAPLLRVEGILYVLFSMVKVICILLSVENKCFSLH
jgi:hypothetical protein